MVVDCDTGEQTMQCMLKNQLTPEHCATTDICQPIRTWLRQNPIAWQMPLSYER